MVISTTAMLAYTINIDNLEFLSCQIKRDLKGQHYRGISGRIQYSNCKILMLIDYHSISFVIHQEMLLSSLPPSWHSA